MGSAGFAKFCNPPGAVGEGCLELFRPGLVNLDDGAKSAYDEEELLMAIWWDWQRW